MNKEITMEAIAGKIAAIHDLSKERSQRDLTIEIQEFKERLGVNNEILTDTFDAIREEVAYGNRENIQIHAGQLVVLFERS